MAQQEITELSTASTPDGSELILVRQDVNDKKLDLVGLKDYLLSVFNSIFNLKASNLSDVADAPTAFNNIKQAATTTSSGAVELATSAEAIAGTDVVRAVTPAAATAAINSLVPAASTTAQGKVELATSAETKTGTDTTRAITPSALKALFDDMFVGQVSTFAMGTAPEGWLKCGGQEVSRATYAKLFAKIGTIYGVGDGSTTFNVPECRGESPRYFDDGRGIDLGRIIGSWQKGSLMGYDQKNNAVFNTSTSQIEAAGQAAIGVDAYETTDYSGVNVTGASLNTSTTLPYDATDKGGSGVVRPRNIAFLACIKY